MSERASTAVPSEFAIELIGLQKSFGHVEVLTDINVGVRPGETVCIIGPSGSGKSTVLR